MLTFSEPYEASNGVVVITVTRTGWFERNQPVGIFTVTPDGAAWTPAVDFGRVALIGATAGLLAAAFATFALVRRPPWPNLTEDAMIALAQAKKR